MWDKVLDAQFKLITRKYGKKVAEQANYGWGDATKPGYVDIATKVYGPGKILCSFANFPSKQIFHAWEDY